MISIAILLPDLRPGGAERLHLNLAREWLRRGIRVEFVLNQARGDLLSLLPVGATVFDLGARRMRDVVRPLLHYLRAKQPDVVLAAMWPLTTVLPLAAKLSGYRGSVAISEHSPLSLAYRCKGRLHDLALRLSTSLGYRLAHARVGVSTGVTEDMSRISGMPRERFTVIHNPAALGNFPTGSLVRPATLSSVEGPLILSVGTLKAVKRHDLLLQAFVRLPVSLGATLCILGEGDQRASLQQMVVDLGLVGRVFLPGFVAETTHWYAHADLFVLSSDYEGFGNVIVEAMEQGIPVVSTDCPCGPAEILENGKYGRLVPCNDPDALAAAMHAALSSPVDRQALKLRARDFSADKIAEEYLDVMLPNWRDRVCA